MNISFGDIFQHHFRKKKGEKLRKYVIIKNVLLSRMQINNYSDDIATISKRLSSREKLAEQISNAKVLPQNFLSGVICMKQNQE